MKFLLNALTARQNVSDNPKECLTAHYLKLMSRYDEG